MNFSTFASLALQMDKEARDSCFPVSPFSSDTTLVKHFEGWDRTKLFPGKNWLDSVLILLFNTL